MNILVIFSENLIAILLFCGLLSIVNHTVTHVLRLVTLFVRLSTRLPTSLLFAFLLACFTIFLSLCMPACPTYMPAPPTCVLIRLSAWYLSVGLINEFLLNQRSYYLLSSNCVVSAFTYPSICLHDLLLLPTWVYNKALSLTNAQVRVEKKRENLPQY